MYLALEYVVADHESTTVAEVVVMLEVAVLIRASVRVTEAAVTEPDRLSDVPVAAPIAGVTRVGVLANTKAPVPVSSVTAEIRFADDGVARNVATFAPRPSTPVEIGNPVALVRTPDAGVPRAGVVSVGDVRVLFVRVSVTSLSAVPLILNSLPEATFTCSENVQASVASTQLIVLSVAPLRVIPPPSAPASVGVSTEPRTRFLSSTVISVELIVVVVPLTVKSPDKVKDVPVAAPMFGVTSVGVLANTNAPVPVSSVTAAAKLALDGVAKKVATPFPRPEIPVATGRPVALVRVPDDGVPRAGVVSVGLVKVLFVRV